MTKELSLRILLCGLAWALSACATIQEKHPGISGERPSYKAPLAGSWEGRWMSDKHRNSSGRLHCEMAPTGPGVYRARFLAQWHVFRTGYDVTIQAQSRGGRILFEGAYSLPAIFGGEYRYRGVLKGNLMEARYDSAYDFGALEMRKVIPAAEFAKKPHPAGLDLRSSGGAASGRD